MNYYPFHIGDYAAHTGHLEPMEDLAYRRLLDQYYLKEGPLPADIQVTAKLVRMEPLWEVVSSVLNEFFTLSDAGWVNRRCEREIRSHNLRHGHNHYIRFRPIVFGRDGLVCAYCGAIDVPLELDHIIPRSRGGLDHPDNLTPACKPCNTSKGAKHLEDWLATR